MYPAAPPYAAPPVGPFPAPPTAPPAMTAGYNYAYGHVPPANPYNPGFAPPAPYPWGATAQWPTTYYNNMVRQWPGAPNWSQYYYGAPPHAVAGAYNPTFDTGWWANGGRPSNQNQNLYAINPNNNGPMFSGQAATTTTTTNNNPATTTTTAATTTAASTTATTQLGGLSLTKDELTRMVGTIDNDFTKGLLQLLTVLVDRDRRLAGNNDQNVIFDIMNNSMNTNNIINNVASLLNTINRADRLLGDSEATADTELRDKIVSSRSHIQQVGRQFYDRINQLSNINTINPFNDRRLSLINTAIGVANAHRHPAFYDFAYETFFNFNSIMRYGNPNGEFICTLLQSLITDNDKRNKKRRISDSNLVSIFVGDVESFAEIRDKHLNLRPLDLDIAEFIATNVPLETLMSFANAMGRSSNELDMELANLVQYTNAANSGLSFTIPRKNMIQRQPKSADDVLAAHMVEGDVFFRKMAVATLLFNQYDRRELLTTTPNKIYNSPGHNHLANPYKSPRHIFNFLDYRPDTGFANLEFQNDVNSVPVMVPAIGGQVYEKNGVSVMIPAPVPPNTNTFQPGNYGLISYLPSVETIPAATATSNASYVYENVLLKILIRFLDITIVNPVTRMVNIQRAMYEVGYQSDNLDEFVAELMKENEAFNIVPPCATNKYDLQGLRDLAKVMGIPAAEVDRVDNKLELCDMIVKADNQPGGNKGRLFAKNGANVGANNAQVIEVQRRMDTIFRRVFSDWVVNSFVLPNNYDQVTFEDFRRNVNVFDKLISNQRLSESAKTKVITKLKNVRGPSHNILTSPKLAILHDYMVAFMDMDGVVHTEMIIDRIRRP